MQGFCKNELAILETLRREAPHPNILPYLGCAVMDVGVAGSGEGDLRVVSIVMEKYKSTLAERCEKKQPPLDVDTCIAEVSAALTCLNGKNLCHNDDHLHDVMLKDDETAVLVNLTRAWPRVLPWRRALRWNGASTRRRAAARTTGLG